MFPLFPASTGLGFSKIHRLHSTAEPPSTGRLPQRRNDGDFLGQGWPRYSEGASCNEAYVDVRLHQSDSGCRDDFHSEPVAGVPRISTTERAKNKIEEFDRSIPDPEDRYDAVRVEAEIYLVVLENALPDELMVQREPTSWSCTVMQSKLRYI